ncbi:hypothetical protein GOP47_0011919 [Adiantum capillus-veneris]|uniref:Pentatricopeptide repeat-containing protein n=1 Tax=Adiantum capillus-veneris TaxID=13818 RepID=A0A9D4UU57_ADICA|nr:hypothetical protein GOP47_0011919 [Adiantum capillus-veneris]
MAAQAEEALQSLLRAHFRGSALCHHSLSSLLQNIAAVKDLASARMVHALIVSSNLQSISLLGDHLIRVFAACGTLVEACLAFSQNSDRSTYTWQAIMSSHVAHEEYEVTLALYQDMHLDGIMPNKFIYPCVLQACSGACILEQGRLLHDHIQKSAADSVLVVCNTLLDMYIKCNSVKDASKVFDNMHHKDVVSWGSMMSGYSQHGDGHAALDLFNKMQGEGITPNRVAFLCALRACADTHALIEGRLLHEQIIRLHFEADVLVANTLIDMYAKCGSLEDARNVLRGLRTRIVSSWNAMMGGYTQYGAVEPALGLFSTMQRDGTTPDTVTYACVLTACGSKGDLEQGMSLHEHITCTGLESNEFVGNSLIDMYAKCGGLDEARNIFDNLPRKNSVSWGAIFAGYAQHNCGVQAFELLWKMLQKGIDPDEIALSCILKACSCFTGSYWGNVMHSYVVSRGLENDLIVGNTLVDMYAKLGSLVDARGVFNRLASPNVVSWGAILAGYSQHDQGESAVEFFRKMLAKKVKPDDAVYCCVIKACGSSGLLEQGRWVHEQVCRSGIPSDVAVGNALIEMYVKCDFLEDARKVFDTMRLCDVVSWNLLLAAYAQDGQALAVLKLFEKMQRGGTEPNQVTFLVLLQVCGSSGALQQVRQLHTLIYECGLGSDLVLSNSLIDTYGKCGTIEDSSKVFDGMPDRDEVSWGAIIAGYTQNGKYRHALQSFDAMQRSGIKPNSLIYTNILSACSRSGRIKEGRKYFRSMKDFSVMPTVEHFNCMIDLLGRAGLVTGAKELLESMPISPNALGWTSLLNSCKAYAETDIGEDCHDHCVVADRENLGANVLMPIVSEEIDNGEVEVVVGLQSSLCKESTAPWREINSQVEDLLLAVKYILELR